MKAFPWSIDNGESVRGEKGMDLRDYFAAKAMQGLIAHKDVEYGKYSEAYDESRTERAYKIADAMMKARDRVENSHEVIAEALAKLNKAAEDNGENL